MPLKAAPTFLSQCAVAFLMMSSALALAQPANPDPVFRLGIFDRSSHEFARGHVKSPVDVDPQQPGAEKNWYANQPSVSAGERPGAAPVAAAPRTITFHLSSQPDRAYRLHVAVLIESAGVPALRVGINRKHGMFYLRPKLDFASGDTTDAFDPIYSHADVRFVLPGTYLHQGTNTITLQAIEPAGHSAPGVDITYDAVELDRCPQCSPHPTPSADLLPTIFYRTREGRLQEVVDALIRDIGEEKPGAQAVLTIGGRRYIAALSGHEDFGEEMAGFEVPEFAPGTPAQLAWTNGSHHWSSQQTLNPGKKWTLFVVPNIHLDIGYTDYRPKVAAIQSRAIGEALDFMKKHPEFRFSMDGAWCLDQFVHTHSVTEQQRAITAIRERKLYLPAQYANLLTGFPTAEVLIRSLYPSADFSRIHKLPFDYANITDVPSYTWSYASILASAGIKEFLAAANNYRAPVLLRGRLEEQSPFWWEGPDGKRVLMWYSRHYMQTQLLFGLPPVAEAGVETLPLFLQMYEAPTYRAHAAIIFGTQVENTDLFPQQAALVQQWNSLYAWPKLQYSGIYDALHAIAQQSGSGLPVIRGDGGPYWEDDIASDARYAAIERDTEARAPSAEKLQTLSSLIDPRLTPDTSRLNRMWKDMVLMDEHTMTSYNAEQAPRSKLAIGQLDEKRLFAVQARASAAWLARGGMAGIVNSISAGSGSIVVFNTLNWKRSGFVTVDLKNGLRIVDPATGKTIPFQTIFQDQASRRVRFIAGEVPPVGYKVFVTRPAGKEAAVARQTGRDPATIESPYYRIRLDPESGAIRSIVDKQLGKELVNLQSPFRFGQYLYVMGGDREPNTLMMYRPGSRVPHPAVHPAGGGRIVSISPTPFGWEATMESSDTNTPRISTHVLIFDQKKKIELIEDVDKKYVESKEGVYFAFPFAMSHPTFQYEIQNGVVNPAKDMYPGAGHEWFSVQHWVSVEENGLSGTIMPLDASLVTLGDINRGEWPKTFGSRAGTIFSYVMNNYRDTGHPAGQGGHFRFRYVVTSAPSSDAAKLSRMGWEEITPLESDEVTSQDKAIDTPRALNGHKGSFLEMDDPDLLLDTWKPAEDSNGTILRFIDLGGVKRTTTVHIPLLHVSQAWLTDAVERNRKQLPLVGADGFSVPIQPHGITTVRLVGTPTTQRTQ